MTEPVYIKKWKEIGFLYVDIYDGYMRISDKEMDIPGATVILLDGYGEFRAYKIGDNEEELAIEFTVEMSKCLLRTWRWLKIDWIGKA